MRGRSQLDRSLETDPQDVGCEEAMELLNIYVELIADDANAGNQISESLLTCERVVRVPTTSRGFSLPLKARRPDRRGANPLGQSERRHG